MKKNRIVKATLAPPGLKINSEFIFSKKVRLYIETAEEGESAKIDIELPERLLYLPEFLRGAAEKFEIATTDGGRGAVLDKIIRFKLDAIGIDCTCEQEFAVSVKGIGISMSLRDMLGPYPKKLNFREKIDYLLKYGNTLRIFSNSFYGRPVGGNEFQLAKHAVEMTEKLIALNKCIRMGIKFFPTVHAIRLPKAAAEKIHRINQHEPNNIPFDYGIEIRLIPSQIRADEPENFKFLNKKQLNATMENVAADLVKFLEVIPLTTQLKGSEIEWLLIGENSGKIRVAKDLIINELGAWFADLESAVFEKAEEKKALKLQSETVAVTCMAFIAVLQKLIAMIPTRHDSSAKPNRLKLLVQSTISKSKLVKLQPLDNRTEMRLELENPNLFVSYICFLNMADE